MTVLIIIVNFEYVGLTKDVSFYEYMNSRELFNAIRNSKINLVRQRINNMSF